MSDFRQFRVTLDDPEADEARTVIVQARTEVQSQDAASKLMRPGERIIAVNEIKGASSPAPDAGLAFPGTQTHPDDRGA
ncbi:hypothetical protein [Brevundimonas sp.]|uniref:hypothetical protein n=1 Tax=Brevundimonas sp. TaxID=1871086 RepID=UPI001D81C79F|nr:hypothetical protein [Brevundimonas sp.]MBA3999464.1 hypothetical protein [Brevundimonas sp.]